MDDSGLIDDSDSDDLNDSNDSDFEATLSRGRHKQRKVREATVDPESLSTAQNLLNILVTNLNSEVSIYIYMYHRFDIYDTSIFLFSNTRTNEVYC